VGKKLKILTAIIIFNFVACISIAQPQESIHQTNIPDKIAPSFKFITLEGDTIRSSQLQGKIIIIDFWNTTCIPCRKSMPKLEKLYGKYKTDSDVEIFIVNSGWESLEKAKQFANEERPTFLFFFKKKLDLPFAYDIDSRTFNSFQLTGNPSTVIIDKHNKVRVLHSGALDDVFTFLDTTIQKLLNDE